MESVQPGEGEGTTGLRGVVPFSFRILLPGFEEQPFNVSAGERTGRGDEGGDSVIGS